MDKEELVIALETQKELKSFGALYKFAYVTDQTLQRSLIEAYEAGFKEGIQEAINLVKEKAEKDE